MSNSGLIGETVRVKDLRQADRLSSSGGWRQVPRLTRDALRVAWSASPRTLIASLLLQAGAGVAMMLQLLAAKFVLDKLVELGFLENITFVDLLPAFSLLIGAMVAMGAFMALAEQRQRLLAELVGQHALAQIIGISSRVDMAAFENPNFYDHLERARTSAITRSVQMVSAVSGVTLNILMSAGVAGALLWSRAAAVAVGDGRRGSDAAGDDPQQSPRLRLRVGDDRRKP